MSPGKVTRTWERVLFDLLSSSHCKASIVSKFVGVVRVRRGSYRGCQETKGTAACVISICKEYFMEFSRY